ncbi:MAG TPA: hypothetical protein VHG28_20130 [Longimicrobiaceae bacterium]|nr:hypothetical protein [Longimicrobiaceae bacterium]
MPEPVTLIVPIRVSALCVSPLDVNTAHGQAPMADFARLPYASDGAVHNRGPYVSTRVLASSGPFEGAVSLPAGIHLHWTLPAGLSNAVQAESGGAIAFPAVPNRWLVERIVVTTSSGASTVSSWVVESDRLSTTPTAPPGLAQPTVPVGATPGQNFRYLGQAFPAQGWAEAEGVERLSPLTAVGYGEPAFAAYYPNCCTVFGFYDALEDLSGYDPSGQTLTYYVQGWYSDPTADPLGSGQVLPGENPYGWTWTEGAPPTQTLCTGVIDEVGWDPTITYLGAAPAPLTAALAASPQEALSALMAGALAVAHPDQDFSNTEALLNALQFGLLSRPLTPDSLEEFEELVHAAGFGSLPGGTLWSVVAADDGGDGGEGGEATLPAGQGAQLDQLNVLQLRLDDLRREVAARRHQVFVDWYKYLVTAYQPLLAPPALRTRLTDVRRYLEAEMAEIGAISAPGGAADLLQAEVDAASAALAAALDPSLRLAGDGVAPRFRRPGDPVLVLSGADVVPRGRPDPAGESGGLLRCRTNHELVSYVTLAAGAIPGSEAAGVGSGEMGEPYAAPLGFTVETFQGAVSDAYFWTIGLQPAIAQLISRGGGSNNPARMDFAGTVALLQAAAAAFVEGEPTGAVTYTGVAPAPRSAGSWSGTPWLPLLLQYDVSFGPLQPILPSTDPAPYGPDFILDGFGFDADSIDLVYHGTPPQARQGYTGTAVLSAGAATDLAGSLRRWMEGTGSDDPRVAEALAAVATMPLLAQGMSGMGEEMLMRRQTLQMAVADPLAPRPVQPFVAAVAAAVADQSSLSPLPQVGFNPVRAGTLAVERLRLVDTFGQFRDYESPGVVVARGLAPPPGLDLPAGTAFLPPRVVQPSRLLFRWLSTAGTSESTPAPATSPVFGWVLPNYLDRALDLYSADGSPLGALGLSADGESVLWSVAPGGAWPLGTSMDEVMAGQDPNLAAFAGALWSGGATYFAPFFEAVREALAFALPERFREDVGTAILLGQPLVLARATLTLSLAGPAATDESWTSFAAAVLGGDDEQRAAWDGGLTRVRFPVKLGAPAQLGDTLVGFWTSADGATDWTTFYAPAAAGSNGPVAPPGDDTVMLTPRAESAPDVTVTLLLDPRGQVHATTGILPVGTLSIPPSQYADALRSLAVAFAAGPVLSGSNLPAGEDAPPPMSLVRPRVASGEWTWVTVAGGAWASTTLADAPSAAGTLSYSPQHVSDGWMVLTGPGTSSPF